MNMKILSVTVLTLASSICGFGEVQTQQDKVPATKLEAFQARSGIVLVKGFTTVAKINDEIEVIAQELRDARDPSSRTTGIAIEVKVVGRSNTSYIDADEIDSLLAGIDYVSKVGKDVTTLADFEADYRTKGDLEVAVYSSKGQIKAAVSSGGIGKTISFISLSELSRLRDAIATAKSKLSAS